MYLSLCDSFALLTALIYNEVQFKLMFDCR